jgi:hypothetical protein
MFTILYELQDEVAAAIIGQRGGNSIWLPHPESKQKCDSTFG